MNLIIKLLEKYLIEYPELGIEKICDFFSLDYTEEELCEYNYTHNDQGEPYLEQEEDISIMLEHEINSSQIDCDFMDVFLIRGLEESMFFKRIVIHEIGHAIAMCYEVAQDLEVKRLFAKYQKGFEDIDEFIAECFMVSELTARIPLANSVKERIKMCRKNFRERILN